MSTVTLKQLEEAQRQTDVAKKKLDEALENYITAREVSYEALKAHNRS